MRGSVARFVAGGSECADVAHRRERPNDDLFRIGQRGLSRRFQAAGATGSGAAQFLAQHA